MSLLNTPPSRTRRHSLGRCAGWMAGVATCMLALSAHAQTWELPGGAGPNPPWQLRLEAGSARLPEPGESPIGHRYGLTGWAVNPAGYALGMRVDVSTPRGTGLMATLPGSTNPSVDLGVRWRTSAWGLPAMDVAAWYRLGNPAGLGVTGSDASLPALTTSIEMRLDGSSGAGLLPKSSTIGLQVQGSGLPALRAKGNARSVLYYRTQF